MIYVGVIVGIVALAFWILARKRGGGSLLHRRIVGSLVVLYGIYLATLTGSYTSVVLPGFGSIVIGAGTGAAIGLGTWVVVGTVGVVTGGVGVAVGAGAMVLIGAVFGSAGGAASGVGIHNVSYPLVSPLFWVPVIVIGIYFFRGTILKKQQLLAAPSAYKKTDI